MLKSVFITDVSSLKMHNPYKPLFTHKRIFTYKCIFYESSLKTNHLLERITFINESSLQTNLYKSVFTNVSSHKCIFTNFSGTETYLACMSSLPSRTSTSSFQFISSNCRNRFFCGSFKEDYITYAIR